MADNRDRRQGGRRVRAVAAQSACPRDSVSSWSWIADAFEQCDLHGGTRTTWAASDLSARDAILVVADRLFRIRRGVVADGIHSVVPVAVRGGAVERASPGDWVIRREYGRAGSVAGGLSAPQRIPSCRGVIAGD